MGSLSGIRILDLTRVVAGPHCTQMLGDLGADVVKVESLKGDETRTWGPPFMELRGKPSSAYFQCMNRNKRSVALALGTEAGTAVFEKLLDWADVVMDNFKPSTLPHLGLDPDAAIAKKPSLIWLSLTAFGSKSPRSSEPGYDAVIQAMSGVMSVTGPEDGPPTKLGIAWVDLLTGQAAAISILAALVERSKTGKGRRLEVNLYDVALGSLANIGSAYLATGIEPKRLGNRHPQIVPYGTFLAKDGWVMLGVGNDDQFKKLMAATATPEDPRFCTNESRVAYREEVEQLISALIQTQSRAYWEKVCGEIGVPFGLVQTVGEALNDKHSIATNRTIEMDGVKMVASPLTGAEYRLPPPGLGEHTISILEEIGISSQETAALIEAEIVKV